MRAPLGEEGSTEDLGISSPTGRRPSGTTRPGLPATEGSSPAGVVVTGVSKSFGSCVALSNVSLRAPRGSVTGLIGRNGAGKTTLLRIVLGLSHPDSGAVLVDGLPPQALAPGTVGACLGPAAHPGRRGRTHLRALAAVGGVPNRAVDDALADVALSASARTAVKHWSLGMRQRLALAAALLGNPAVLVLDEPTNGLDPDGIVWLRSRLRALADAGRCVVVSSHLLLELAQVADHFVLLDRHVRWAGSADEVRRCGGIEELYRTVVEHHGAGHQDPAGPTPPRASWRTDIVDAAHIGVPGVLGTRP